MVEQIEPRDEREAAGPLELGHDAAAESRCAAKETPRSTTNTRPAPWLRHAWAWGCHEKVWECGAPKAQVKASSVKAGGGNAAGSAWSRPACDVQRTRRQSAGGLRGVTTASATIRRKRKKNVIGAAEHTHLQTLPCALHVRTVPLDVRPKLRAFEHLRSSTRRSGPHDSVNISMKSEHELVRRAPGQGDPR